MMEQNRQQPQKQEPQKQEPILLFEDRNGNLLRMTPSQIERWQAAGSPALPGRASRKPQHGDR